MSVPLIVYARQVSSSDEQLYRALVLSNLVAIHQKTGIGRLSAFCGRCAQARDGGRGHRVLFGWRRLPRGLYHAVVNALSISGRHGVRRRAALLRQQDRVPVNAGIPGLRYVPWTASSSRRRRYREEGQLRNSSTASPASATRQHAPPKRREIIRIMLGA